ncbi:MAG TPA: type II secretion system protein [Accumulibacter sp.]|nr:type II secretion system protein [Accumulibacter sp.]
MCIDGPVRRCRESGVTLVELIVFIVVVSVGVVGLLSVSGPMLRNSADPMVRKQMTVIAESLLNEVMQQPYTYCDPDDANYLSATSTAGCTGGAVNSQDKGGAALTTPTPATETRYGAVGTQFDNVADYGGFSRTPIDDVAGGNAMTGYTASVAVTRAGATFGLSPTAALQVTVTVQRAGADNFALSGYRFLYAPRN